MVCVTFVYSLRLTKLEQVPERSPFFCFLFQFTFAHNRRWSQCGSCR